MAMPNYIHTFTAKTIDSNMFATISADIVSSTSLSVDETIRLKQRIEALFALLKTKYPDFYGRQIKGDYIECVMQNICSSPTEFKEQQQTAGKTSGTGTSGTEPGSSKR